MILGAILAGGQARRFGSDKGAVEIDGIALLDRAAQALHRQCDALVVVGRDWPGIVRVEDRPGPELGPLGGLAGALEHGRAHHADWVLTSGCDLPEIPDDLFGRLSPGPAIIDGQPLLGLWPTSLADRLLTRLDRGERAMMGWVEVTHTRRVDFGRPIPNINTPGDLERYLMQRTSSSAGPRSLR